MLATTVQAPIRRSSALTTARVRAAAPRAGVAGSTTRLMPQAGVAPAMPALSAIERTLATLLAPLDYPDWASWQAEVHARLLELTGADTLCMYTPLFDGCEAWISPHLSSAQLGEYAAHVAADPSWDIIEHSFRRATAQQSEGVLHEEELLPRAELESSAFFREFLRPNRLLDLTVAGFSFGGRAPARLHFSNAKRRSAAQAEERRHLIRTILPAFRSGLAQWRQMGERRADFGRMLDVLPDAVLLYDIQGTLVHANPAAVGMMGGQGTLTGSLKGTEADRLQIEAQRVAWNMGALSRRTHGSLIGTPGMLSQMTTLPSATRELKVGAQSYTLRGSLAPAWMLGRDPGVMVTVEATSARSTSDADLRERFGLTTREVEVARLVASGLSNQALAEKLGVSFFTARNHVERLMGKMSAMNRAHIGAIVRGDALLE